MSVFVVPGIAGLDVSSERMIASSTSSTEITATGGVAVFDQIIPARSVGPNGYIVLDIYMTRYGPNGDIIPLLALGGESFYTAAMAISDTSFQTRFYIYADDSETSQKLASDAGVATPYYRGSLTKVSLSVDLTADAILSLNVNIATTGDSLIVEGYSIRLFNPSGV